jgi:hypothetical protein
MKTFKELLWELNPYHKGSDGEFYNPDDDPEDGSWSLFFSKPSKGRQRIKKGSKRRLSLPNKVIDNCGRSGDYLCHSGKKKQ